MLVMKKRLSSVNANQMQEFHRPFPFLVATKHSGNLILMILILSLLFPQNAGNFSIPLKGFA